jgi:hypothetical protein
MRKPLMNICQPENPAEFSTGDENWTFGDYPANFYGENFHGEPIFHL